MTGKVLHQDLAVSLVVCAVHPQPDQPDPKGILFVAVIGVLRLNALLRQSHLVHGCRKFGVGVQVFRVLYSGEAIEGQLVLLKVDALDRFPRFIPFLHKGNQVLRVEKRMLVEDFIHKLPVGIKLAASRLGKESAS